MLHEILLTIEARAGTFFHAPQSMLGTPTASHAAIPYVSLHPIAVQLEFMHKPRAVGTSVRAKASTAG